MCIMMNNSAQGVPRKVLAGMAKKLAENEESGFPFPYQEDRKTANRKLSHEIKWSW